ncbi:hypothetical protein ACFCW2_08495 [Qipengyuania sp. DSG2-2]|uniref:hypothetical protein n=1 Tax=Qipengyuania sp. DGS2-2 TaxID=3349631 RepID=UPI0036D2B982
MMILAPLLLMAASEPLPTTQTSPLATPDTSHEWVLLTDDEDGTGWYDKTFRDTTSFEGQSYPVVLIRFTFREDGVDNVGDMTLAVDCDGNRQAVVAGWLQAHGEIIAAKDQPEGMIFDFTERPFDEEDIAIFRQACGEDWSQ